MDKLVNILTAKEIIKLEKDAAFIGALLKDDQKKEKICRVVRLEDLEELINRVKKITPEDLQKLERWNIESELRANINVFYLHYYMIKEVMINN